MNIFVYDPDPKTCALWVDDVRRNKLITEHAQMMTAVLDYRKPVWFKDYKQCRVNYPASVIMHPCTVWLRQSWSNFRWLVQLNQYYIDMWPGEHKSARIMLAAYDACYRFGATDESTPFVNAARNVDLGLDFTNEENTFLAYRKYHVARWDGDNPVPTWRTGKKPSWYKGARHADQQRLQKV